MTGTQACTACAKEVKGLHDKVSRQLIRLHWHSVELGLHGSSLTAAQPYDKQAASQLTPPN